MAKTPAKFSASFALLASLVRPLLLEVRGANLLYNVRHAHNASSITKLQFPD